MELWQISLFVLLPAMALAGYAQLKIKRTFNHYLQVRSRRAMTGGDLARELLLSEGVSQVEVVQIKGRLSDHYNPAKKSLGLSREVYQGSSLASLGVAAHEVGHAIQHKEGYGLLSFRSLFAPAASLASSLSLPLILIGFLLQWTGLASFGIVLFSLVVIFHLVTVPVEINASSRALALLSGGGYLEEDEMRGAKKVLSAAALTYIAALLVSLAQLLRLISVVNHD